MNTAFENRLITCPTCEVDDADVLGQRGGAAHRAGAGEESTIVRCRRCGLIYANPFPFPRDLDALYSASDDYFKHHSQRDQKVSEREGLVSSLEPFVTGRRLLDVGAGQGETVEAALRRGWDAYGVETSARFVEEAQRHIPNRIVHGLVQEPHASLIDGSFDAVILAAVMEHLHEPAAVLAAISRLLKPGGVMFVDVPNEVGIYFRAGNLWQRLQRRNWVVNLAPTFSPFHVFGFSRRSLVAMLDKFGLEPIKLKFYGGVSLVPFQPSLRGAAEWLGSHLVHRVSKLGELGTYIECYARKR